MILVCLSVAGVIMALIPALTFLANLPLFRPTDSGQPLEENDWSISVLIPARDEEAGISASVEAALASHGVGVEVVVLDDHSTDRTAAIVERMAATDQRVRCVAGKTLPVGWNGKQHACWQLAESATHSRLVFLDADVRLQPDALRRLAQRQDESKVALLSAFPHQETGTWLEKLIIPLMHFVLLGFLPISRMRGSAHPAYAAGCGQLFMTEKEAYSEAGTHEKIRASRHDGLKLPRVYRQAGLMTDVVDGTDLAECRMYRSAQEVIRGVLKNAIEGIAAPRLIVPFSVVLLGGSVLPVVTLVLAAVSGDAVAAAISVVGLALGHLPRALAAWRFRQPPLGVALHSLSVLVFVLLQWLALANSLTGRQIAWRGRVETIDQATSTT